MIINFVVRRLRVTTAFYFTDDICTTVVLKYDMVTSSVSLKINRLHHVIAIFSVCVAALQY